ncbi:apolipoprotein D-like [Limulus polyphemus]|uniref:Apolipoprotein D n=1 Tax=Limulus polyphemus TaxID=6850 RepID=A0ABM1BNP5_LIMPO|nr:apolipoprotein D-like [Limulus polyphemus]
MKTKVLLVILIVRLALTTDGQSLAPANCPRPDVVKDFELSKYLGKWYEIQRTLALFERDLQCVTAEYGILKNETISVRNAGINSNGEKKGIEGEATVQNISEPAKLKVRFETAPFPANYWILDTDYDNFAVVWSCFNLGPFGLLHTENLWILGREKVLDEDLLKTIYSKLDKLGIEWDHLRNTTQIGCDISGNNK